MLYTIVSKRKFEFQSTAQKNLGQTITGYQYIAFDDSNEPLEFSAKTGDLAVVRASRFVLDKAVDLDLEPSLFQGRIKYRLVED